MGFNEIARTDSAVLMEAGMTNADDYIHIYGLEEQRFDGEGEYGAAVMNCDPFTKGYRYLIETAAETVKGLYVIVVHEDLSVFPFADRIELVRKGAANLKNVKVISSGTMPYRALLSLHTSSNPRKTTT